MDIFLNMSLLKCHNSYRIGSFCTGIKLLTKEVQNEIKEGTNSEDLPSMEKTDEKNF